MLIALCHRSVDDSSVKDFLTMTNPIGVWLFRPFARSPLTLLPPGSFAFWLVRPLADLPLTLNDSSPLNKCNSTSRFIVIFVFKPRQFMHDDENKRLCECLMLCSVMK